MDLNRIDRGGLEDSFEEEKEEMKEEEKIDFASQRRHIGAILRVLIIDDNTFNILALKLQL